MGEYARTAQPETLARRSCDGSSPTPDITRLKGARFLSMPEPERGLELNAALIKQLTGGDTYTGRFLHENPVEFTPKFKIFINTNHLPRTGDDTVFSSDRVKLIPFERHFLPQEQDTGLKTPFRQQENLSGIFNWLIEGYRMLKSEGLTVPERVLQATKEYRQETDIVGTFPFWFVLMWIASIFTRILFLITQRWIAAKSFGTSGALALPFTRFQTGYVWKMGCPLLKSLSRAVAVIVHGLVTKNSPRFERAWRT